MPFDGPPALVLNADYRPLLIAPLSTWSWQDAIKAVMADRVSVVEEYDIAIHSAGGFELRLPSVIALRHYEDLNRPAPLTRNLLFLRDTFTCQYCAHPCAGDELTFDHIIPISQGGKSTWTNLCLACSKCNMSKGGRTPKQAGMRLLRPPYHPTIAQLNGRLAWSRIKPENLDPTWRTWLGFSESELSSTQMTRTSPAFPTDMPAKEYWNVQIEP